MSRPNFLILMVDQMSGVLFDQPLLDFLHIPNMKKLMARGVTFEKAYSSSPLCTPARGSFMTGMLPSQSGIYDNAAEFVASTPTFAHYLRSLGYQTALSGKMHFVGPDQLHGFEERLTTDIYPADFGWTPDWEKPLERIDWWYHNLSSVTDSGSAEITNQLEFDDDVAYHTKLKLYQYARRIDERPFCLVASFTHPHDPYVARLKYMDLYEADRIPMPAVAPINYEDQDPHSRRVMDAVDHLNFDVRDEDVRRARHAYFANVSYLDEKIGEILGILDDCGFSDNTHIILCSDHGDMIGERGLWYKMTFFEASARIPMVWCEPGASSKKIKAPVALHDILPTLVDFAGGNSEDLATDIEGRSLSGLICGADDPLRTIYTEYCAEGSISPMVMIRRGAYKFCYCKEDPDQLFNLEEDPLELRNIAELNPELIEPYKAEMFDKWDLDRFETEVRISQKSRHLVDAANRQGKFTSWDFQPRQDATQRYMRNHLDLNVLESENRYPKPKD